MAESRIPDDASSRITYLPDNQPTHILVQTISHVCLPDQARALRRELAAWAIGLATEGRGYIVNRSGDRYYGTSKMDGVTRIRLWESGFTVSMGQTENLAFLTWIGSGIFGFASPLSSQFIMAYDFLLFQSTLS